MSTVIVKAFCLLSLAVGGTLTVILPQYPEVGYLILLAGASTAAFCLIKIAKTLQAYIREASSLQEELASCIAESGDRKLLDKTESLLYKSWQTLNKTEKLIERHLGS